MEKTKIRKWNKTSKALVIVAFVAGLLIGSVIAQSFTAPDVYLDDLPSSAYLVVKEDGSYVWSVLYNGQITFNGTDASTVINSAYQALPARTNKICMILSGDFTLTSTIELDDGYVKLIMDGTLRAGNGLNMDMINATDTTQVEITGGEMDGNKYQQTGLPSTVCGIRFIGVTFSSIHDVYIHDIFNDGIMVREGCYEVKVFNNWVYHCGTSYPTGTGIAVSGELGTHPRRIQVYDNMAINNTYDGIDFCLVDDLQVNGNLCENNTLDGLAVYGCSYVMCSDNTCRYNGKAGIMADACLKLVVTGCHISENDGHGISCLGGLHLEITGNFIWDNDYQDTSNYDGIVVNATEVLINSNTILENFNAQIHVGSATSGCLIDGNNLNKYMATYAILIDAGATGLTIRDNWGYKTEASGSSTGTGAQQTIAHGLVGTPTSVVITPTATGATVALDYADATNFYVTVTNAIAYNWDACIT